MYFVVTVEICLRVSNGAQHDCRMISVLVNVETGLHLMLRDTARRMVFTLKIVEEASRTPSAAAAAALQERRANTLNRNFTFEWLPWRLLCIVG